MTIRVRGLGIALAIILGVLFALYVWPTAWSYPQGQVISGTQVLPVGCG